MLNDLNEQLATIPTGQTLYSHLNRPWPWTRCGLSHHVRCNSCQYFHCKAAVTYFLISVQRGTRWRAALVLFCLSVRPTAQHEIWRLNMGRGDTECQEIWGLEDWSHWHFELLHPCWAGQRQRCQIRNKNGRILCVWMLVGQNDGEMSEWIRPPPGEFGEQSCSTSCNAEHPGRCCHRVSVEDALFFFFPNIAPKQKAGPPAELLCRGWALSEPTPSPSETPGRPSTCQHPLVCSPVRFHPLALMIPLILFPSTLLHSSKTTFLPLFSPLCCNLLPVSLSVHPTQLWCLILPPPIPVTSSLLPLQLIWKSLVSFLLASIWIMLGCFLSLPKQQSDLARTRVCGKAQGVGLNK